MIKDVGYDYVELNGRNFADRKPSELKAILNDIGLPSPITHADYSSLAERPDALADIAAELGCKYVVLPFIAEDQRSLDAYKAHAEMLNKASEVLKPNGIKVGYHNHHFEFFDLGNSVTGMDILLSDTDPDQVVFELDLFWAAFARQDIVAWFQKHPGRFKMCHVKDMLGEPREFRSAEEFFAVIGSLMKNVGEGELPFETYFANNDLAGMEYFIVEHDAPPKPFRNSIETSLTNVRGVRF
ncbi:MAG: sugar phosphate isomerase/epimerase [Pseudomonadota bacterium]